jgi:hypothetical protein
MSILEGCQIIWLLKFSQSLQLLPHTSFQEVKQNSVSMTSLGGSGDVDAVQDFVNLPLQAKFKTRSSSMLDSIFAWFWSVLYGEFFYKVGYYISGSVYSPTIGDGDSPGIHTHVYCFRKWACTTMAQQHAETFGLQVVLCT